MVSDLDYFFEESLNGVPMTTVYVTTFFVQTT